LPLFPYLVKLFAAQKNISKDADFLKNGKNLNFRLYAPGNGVKPPVRALPNDFNHLIPKKNLRRPGSRLARGKTPPGKKISLLN
jgi:hypothetical protein